ncbi:GNAT family N-acetyltransferase [Cereibacter sphaeroides]|nr:GNAT family N-acetyltransferase [Cereibacter sphaeroides]
MTPLDILTTSAAARLIALMREEINGRPVCTAEEVTEALLKAYHVPAYHGFVASDGTGICGYLGLNDRYAVYSGGAFLQITELVVSPDRRGRGIGRLLLDHAEEVAQAAGFRNIEVNLPAAERLPGTHAFYTACGYTSRGVRTSRAIG